MSQQTGLTDHNQPLTDEEAALIFEEIYNGTAAGATPSDRKVNKALKEHRAESEDAATEVETGATEEVSTEVATTEEVQVTAEGTQEGTQEGTAAEQAAGAQTTVKPEDYEAVLKRLQAAEHKAKSLDGRESARARQIAELEARIRELQTPKKADKPAPSVEEDDDWKALAESDPAFAKLLAKREENLRKSFQQELEERLEKAVEPVYRQQAEDYGRTEYEKLKQWVPNADDILKSQFYADWYHAQPQAVRDMANQSAQSAFKVLQLYNMDMEAMYPPEKTEEKQTKPAVSEQAVKLQEQRAARVAVGSVGAKQTPKQSAQEELDPEAYFKKVYEETKKQNQRR